MMNLQYEEKLQELQLWILEDRRIHANLIKVLKIVKGLSSIKLGSVFELDNEGITRGHK